MTKLLMIYRSKALLAGALILNAGLAACSGSAGKHQAPPTTVVVKAVKLEPHRLSKQLTVYGQVQPDPGAVHGVSLPQGGEVVALSVGAGERVKAGQPLLTLATNPQARLAYEQAQAEIRYAKSELARTKKLYQQHLATNTQLAQAKKTLVTAKAALAAQKRQGAGQKTTVVHSPYNSIVTSINVAPGDRVAANALLMKLANQNRLWVHLGVQSEDRNRVRPGMPVTLTPVFQSGVQIDASIAQLHAVVNAQTRLVDMIVKLTGRQAAPLVPGMWMRGVITIKQTTMLAVPRLAVLRDERGAYVFVVRHHKAHRVGVTTAFEDGGLTGISGPVKAGDTVVVQGNHELQDGMAVRESRP